MAQHKTDPNQLDIFKEATKDIVERKLKEENDRYERKKRELRDEISATERALNDSTLPYNERKDYESDKKDSELKLDDLEQSHTQAVAAIMAELQR